MILVFNFRFLSFLFFLILVLLLLLLTTFSFLLLLGCSSQTHKHTLIYIHYAQVSSLNDRLAIASETQGKQQAALIDQLKAELSTRIESLASNVGCLEEQKSSGAQVVKALEVKLNKVYKALSREATRGREDREGLWGSLSELSCRISEIRAIVE